MMGGSLRLGKVQSVNPSSNAATLLMLDDGSLLPGVQILRPHASTNSGDFDLPVPTLTPSGNSFDPTMTRSRDIIAVVAFAGRTPFVVGFLTTQIGQMTFAEPGFSIRRHQSDWYESVDAEANHEWFHPSGTYCRIGSSPDHADLTGADVDGLFKIAANTSSAPYLQLTVKNAGNQVASFQVSPEGNVTVACNGNISATVGGNLSATATGTAEITSMGNMTLTAPQILLDTPTVTITGVINVEGQGASGNVGTITGTLHVVDGDVTADSISLKDHVHSDPQGGDTGPASE